MSTSSLYRFRMEVKEDYPVKPVNVENLTVNTNNL